MYACRLGCEAQDCQLATPSLGVLYSGAPPVLLRVLSSVFGEHGVQHWAHTAGDTTGNIVSSFLPKALSMSYYGLLQVKKICQKPGPVLQE
jgi:hypothetical protein